ncbi:hypothetical protein SDRG_02153 [Saprolegnia diclina VS20]|uniref:Uncharacterized protein n=1 Tax=Saprolegnia diclina (strain VS20) TaxID=1156394 RepID=T0QSI0_SAPDV|nr:hypothetical protein SDRG_02153 [Saprolegnia diclina VS20]EQC41104.1 hypothetical protein SDRG_02153 [Saprolegnia diclina VS20]|eukprot:XP_008605948.1 hypothetical protein SDRG_02153 [Saprolegnia diclina VS20]
MPIYESHHQHTARKPASAAKQATSAAPSTLEALDLVEALLAQLAQVVTTAKEAVHAENASRAAEPSLCLSRDTKSGAPCKNQRSKCPYRLCGRHTDGPAATSRTSSPSCKDEETSIPAAPRRSTSTHRTEPHAASYARAYSSSSRDEPNLPRSSAAPERGRPTATKAAPKTQCGATTARGKPCRNFRGSCPYHN